MYFQVYFSPGTTDISTLPKQVKGDLQVRAQGEDKPSPLLCLRSSLPSHFVHSRGDGLSSPWGFLTLDGHARLQKSHARRPWSIARSTFLCYTTRMLTAQLDKHLNETFHLDLGFSAEVGKTTVLLGESGA